MSRWLVIVGYKNMGMDWNNCASKCTQDVKSCSVSVKYSTPININENTDKSYSIVLVSTEEKVNIDCYEKMLKQIKIDTSDEIIIFCHEYRNDHTYGSTKETLDELNRDYNKLEFFLFPGTKTNLDGKENYPFWLAMDVDENIENNNENSRLIFKKSWTSPDWEKLKQEVKKKSVIKPLSFLKHRIAHLWLPLYIDLQGLADVKDVVENQRRYAEEIIDEYGKRNNAFLQLIKDLQFLIAGENLVGIDKTETSLSKVDLPEGKCIWDIIKEKGLQDNEEVKNLLDIAGVSQDRNSKLKVQKDSAIQNFFSALNDSKNPEEFLQNIDQGVNKNLTFLQWHVALNSVLNNLTKLICETSS